MSGEDGFGLLVRDGCSHKEAPSVSFVFWWFLCIKKPPKSLQDGGSRKKLSLSYLVLLSGLGRMFAAQMAELG